MIAMLAGFSEIEFTPSEGNSPGDFIPHFRSGSDGGLFANVAAFTSEGESVILISMDILSFHADYGNAMRKRISEATGVPAAQMCIFGDRLYTDIAVGKRHGITAVLVLSGETDEVALAACAEEDRPDAVLPSLEEANAVLFNEI